MSSIKILVASLSDKGDSFKALGKFTFWKKGDKKGWVDYWERVSIKAFNPPTPMGAGTFSFDTNRKMHHL